MVHKKWYKQFVFIKVELVRKEFKIIFCRDKFKGKFSHPFKSIFVANMLKLVHELID